MCMYVLFLRGVVMCGRGTPLCAVGRLLQIFYINALYIIYSRGLFDTAAAAVERANKPYHKRSIYVFLVTTQQLAVKYKILLLNHDHQMIDTPALISNKHS